MSKIASLGKLTRIPLRTAWEHEASDFTPWLTQPANLAELADALGLDDLELVATEHWIGDFKLDVLCTAGGEQVIIENQLAETDHKHLGQLLAYAAGVGARKVVWISELFRPEHAAALAYLNEHSSEDFAFFGVQVELWRIGDSPMAAKFEVVVRPDNWSRAGRTQAQAAAQSTPTKQLQLKFWQALVAQLATDAPGIKPHRPRLQHWLSVSIGKSGILLQATANTREDRLGVEIWMQRDDSKELFAALRRQREQAERALGFALDWQELPDAQACRIVVSLDGASLSDESRWPEYLEWVSRHLVAMHRVFKPMVAGLG